MTGSEKTSSVSRPSAGRASRPSRTPSLVHEATAMKRRVAALLALTAVGCAKPGTHVSSEVVWARVDADAFPVSPGDIVRIEASGPVQVTSVIGSADVIETVTPKD